jgi:hypothetical protein
MNDPAISLQSLRDIVVPDPPPLWPPAPGVWVVLVIVLAVVLAVVLGWRRARARSAYRRAGLALLATARTVRDVDVVLKRVALAVFPRPQVASLYGADWAAFLDSTCSKVGFASLAPRDPAAEISSELLSSARTWVRHHRVPKSGVQDGGPTRSGDMPRQDGS